MPMRKSEGYIPTVWRADMAWQDPIVEEVRKARDAYAKQFNYDLDAICRDLQHRQEQSGRKLFSFPARRKIPALAGDSKTSSQQASSG